MLGNGNNVTQRTYRPDSALPASQTQVLVSCSPKPSIRQSREGMSVEPHPVAHKGVNDGRPRCRDLSVLVTASERP